MLNLPVSDWTGSGNSPVLGSFSDFEGSLVVASLRLLQLFLGSILYPVAVRCPLKNAQSWDLNTNLAIFSIVMTAASWVISSLPWQRTSSTIPALLRTLLSTLSIFSWKTYPDTFSPKSGRSHRHLAQGVLMVVRKPLCLGSANAPSARQAGWNTSNLPVPVWCHQLFCCTTASPL